MERHLYNKYDTHGIGSMLVINLVLFGPLGLSIWAAQMLWIPVFAAGSLTALGITDIPISLRTTLKNIVRGA
jgi:stearoyl-CoA desaturase (delta-9 desaturase)